MSPLYTGRVATALSRKSVAFDDSQRGMLKDMQYIENALLKLENLSRAEVEEKIDGIDHPGARPTQEQDSQPLVLSFDGGLDDHRKAREWALARLLGVTTFAADGSQIFPSKDMSIQVGLVQVGWFENPHSADGDYTKDVHVEVLTPQELSSDFAEREIEWRRFEQEVERTVQFIDRHEGQQALAFFDGSFILSFVSTMPEERQTSYTESIRRLLDHSKEKRVPVVGFVDSSYSSDLTTLADRLLRPVASDPDKNGDDPKAVHIGDAAVLRSRMDWGDRSRLFECARDDKVDVDKTYYGDVLFTYLKTTRDHPPARVELPAWIFEQGLHEWVLDIVRAECIVGVGYPYPLETADAVAVLSMQDRERFYRLFQDFAAERGIKVRFSRKSISKRGRRV